MSKRPRAGAPLWTPKGTPGLWAPFIVGCVLRALLPWYAHGFRYMDEHWQVMEPANYLVHGIWSRTTEWEQGLRSWIYPGLVSLLLRAAEAMGFSDPLWIAAFVRTIHGLFSALAVPLVYLAVKRLSSIQNARVAAWLTALWPFAIYCGFHTHGEMAGALFVLAAVCAPILLKNERNGYLLSGVFFGVALALKIDVAVAGLGFGLWHLFHKRSRALYLAAGVLPLVVLVGAVDALTWGSWFHSVTGHARVNLVEGVGNQWGTSPWYRHVIYYFDIAGALALAAACLLPFVWKRLPENLRAIWFMNFFFVAVFCLIPHKEKRFLAPLVYTSIVATLATLRDSPKWRPALAFCAALTLIHGAANAYTYLLHRSWWDRIKAIHEAGRIPGIQKMLSPQWPAIFYLPRNVPSEATGADPASLARATKGLRSIGMATDWSDLRPLGDLGFRCAPWPTATAPTITRSSDPVPSAYHCVR